MTTKNVSEQWQYGMSMPSRDFTAYVRVTLFPDHVVIAGCAGNDERGEPTMGSFRGRIERSPSYSTPSWTLYDEDGRWISTYGTRRAAMQVAGNHAINGWASPIRKRVAATERYQHTIGGRPISPENPGTYGRTHDMQCPACVASGASFTASPRSESYWSS